MMEVGDRTIAFDFDSARDREQILDMSPWSVHGQSLNLKECRSNICIEEIEFHVMQMWIQVYGLSLDMHNPDNAVQIANSLGRCKGVETLNTMKQRFSTLAQTVQNQILPTLRPYTFQTLQLNSHLSPATSIPQHHQTTNRLIHPKPIQASKPHVLQSFQHNHLSFKPPEVQRNCSLEDHHMPLRLSTNQGHLCTHNKTKHREESGAPPKSWGTISSHAEGTAQVQCDQRGRKRARNGRSSK